MTYHGDILIHPGELDTDKQLIPTEDQEQATFVSWLQMKGIAHFRVPNETYTTSWAQKNKNKALGVSAGVPDIFIALPHVGLLAIEMKRVANSKTSDAQLQWIATLNTIPGIEACVCKGADKAIKVVESFL